ncbi:polycystin-1-like [Stylophora pistillata]|uniref:polycystin-1-like n=1 Tax=Stylophora pistillata TaxID=50429 RepID=UPI000C0390D8|nr:polycystin-1-like [Stylophora pistillata]
MADQTDCLLPYFSEKWYHSEVALRFYRVPTENVKVGKVSISHHRRRIGEGFNITASVNSDEMGFFKFTVQSGDGNEYVFCQPQMRHFYTNPGNYRVSLIVEDIKGTNVTFSDSVMVADNLTKLELECPRAVPQGEEVECNIKVARALNVTGKFTVENREGKLQELPDTWMSSFGADVPRFLPESNTTLGKLLQSPERIYILTKHSVQKEGYVAGLEFNVIQPGPIRVFILRRVDEVKTLAYSWKSGIICSNLEKLSIDYGTCCPAQCNSMGSNLGSVANLQFVIVDEVTLAQHMSAGYHFVDFANVTQLKVLPGDMLGWYSSTMFGKIGFVEKTEEQCLVYKGVADGIIVGKKLTTRAPDSTSTLSFALRANFVPKTFSKASFNLAEIGSHKLVVGLSDKFGNMAEMTSENILCQRAVEGLLVDMPEAALVGQVVFGVNVTYGTNVSYIINSGDGRLINQSENIVKLNYTTPGARDITVIAFNHVSVAISECEGLLILDEIENISIQVEKLVATDDNFTITISILRGTAVYLNVSFGDDSPGFNISNFDVNNTFTVTKNHSYRRDGIYRISAITRNSLSSALAEKNITVQTRITGLQTFVPGVTVSTDNELVINISVAEGTDVSYEVSLESDKNKTANGLGVTVVFPRGDLKPGVSSLYVKAYNLLSILKDSKQIHLETPISGVLFNLTSPTEAVRVAENYTFALLYDKGSSVRITFWKSIDEESVSLTLQQEKKHLYHSVVYQAPGVFIARVNYSNVLGEVVEERAVMAQYPVKNISVNTNSPVPHPPGIISITVKQDGIVATNATVICSFGDGETSEKREFSGELNISHRYAKAGFHKLVVNISNLASFVSKEVIVDVVKIITFMEVNAKSSPTGAVLRVPSPHNTFPVESPVLFEAEHDGSMSVTLFTFNFGDGFEINGTSRNIMGEHTYTSKGKFNVTLKVIHRFGESWNFTVITMKESIAGLAISDNAPTVLGEPTTFVLNLTKLGTGTLIKVDFGDEQNIFLGDKSNNIEVLPDVVKPIDDSVQNITFEHTYNDISLYVVEVHGWNDVSSMRISHRTVTVEKECRYPAPQILSVGNNISSATNTTKDKELIIYTGVKVSCQATYKTIFMWRLERHDSQGNLSIVDIKTDLNKSSLTIPSGSLPYGIVTLRFTVQMKYIIDGIDSFATGYINVRPAALKAIIYGGGFRKVSSKRSFSIDASVSEDPDVERGDLTGIRFHWYCRRFFEDFRSDLEALPVVTFKDISLHSGNRGCEGSGPARLNYSTSVLRIRPGMLEENTIYVVKLVIRKDTREASFEQTLSVREQVLPDIAIQCKVNCNYKVNTNNRLSVTSICANCHQENFTSMSYKWELYVRDQTTGNWSLDLELDSKTVTNSSKQNLVLKENSLDVGRRYRLVCLAGNEEDQQGQSEHYFTTNVPPRNGNCIISPLEGRVLTTYFHIKCSGWRDMDGPIVYKVFRGRTLLQHGKEATLPPMLLTSGPRQNNYTYYLAVNICDKFHSCTKTILPVTVIEAKISAQDLKSMMAEDGLVTNMRISGNLQGVSQLIMSAASVLASQNAERKSAGSNVTEGDGKLRQMKEELLGALNQLEPESLDTLGVVLEAMSSVTNDVTELSSTAQSTVLNILSNTVATLTEKKNPDSLEAIKSVSAGVMENLGNLFGSSKYQQDRNSLQLEKLKGKEQLETNEKEMDTLHQDSKQIKENARAMTKSAMKILDDILDVIVEFQVPGEEPQLLEGERMTALVSKVDTERLVGSSFSIGEGSFALPSSKGIVNILQDENCYIVAKGLNAKDNPFIWDNSSSGVKSNCLGLKFEDCHGTPLNVTRLQDPIAITIPRDDIGDSPEPGNFTLEEKKIKTHKLNIDDPTYAMNAVIQPGAVNCSHDIEIFLRKNRKPTTELFDFNWTMSVPPKEAEKRDSFAFSVSNYQLNKSASDSGEYYLGLYATLHEESTKDEKCRTELNYTLFTFVSSCNFWDEREELWKASGCEVGPKTTYSSTECLCTHLTNFGGGFLVAPNPIDFDSALKGFTDIASNPTVFATVITIFGLYFVGAIWARWKDKKDLQKLGVTPLLSNDPRDTYGYEITLQTGFQQKSRTTADVFIQLFGTLGDSEPRMLKDPKRPKFGRGEIDQFLLTGPQSLGNIKEIHVWHNNAGRSPAWYLFRVLIRDLQTDSKWWFVCDRWLAVEEGDGAVDQKLKLATKRELTRFNILFVNATRKNLLDGHLWLSVFTRPPKSTFTRVQRLSCCLSLLLSTMLANLMFYQVGADDNSTASQSIHIGPFILSVRQIMIGVQSSFVVLPVNLIIVMIFRKLKPKEDNSRSKRYEEVAEEVSSSSPTMGYHDFPVKAASTHENHGKDATNSTLQMAEISYPEESDNPKRKDLNLKTLLKFFSRDDDDDNTKKAKKKFLFPRWCIYINYLLVAISSLTCGFFCILYGFQFGKEKSDKWLTSMLVSFFQSIIVIQPFKVLLLAAFFALIIKDPNKEEEQEQENVLDPVLSTDEEFIEGDAERGPGKIGLQSKPPDAKKLEAARKLRLKQCEMKAIIKEVVTHILVVCVLLVVAYGNHDNRSFKMTEEVKNVLVTRDSNTISFDALTMQEAFWQWVKNLIANLFPSSTSDDYPYMGIIKSGEVSNVLGLGRIRQLRMKKDTCKVPVVFTTYITECNDYYSWSDEEINDFHQGWSPQNKTKLEKDEERKQISPWQYQGTLEANSFPYLGKMASYRGGGFIFELGPDENTVYGELEKLKTSNWIDRYTRALFTELSIYNVNINLLCVATLLYEELPTGGGQPFVNVQTIRVYRYIGNFSAALMACEVIFTFLLLNWILRDGKRLWRQKKAFWKNVWNIVDIVITSLSVASLVLYFMRLVFLSSALGKVRDDPSKFVSFQYVVLLNEGVNAMVAFVVLLLNLKFLRLLRFNRKISVLSITIKTSASKLASFMLMFMVIFLAYCFLVFLVFGSALEDYRSFIGCMESMMSMVLGNFEFYDLVAVNAVIGPAVFFTFMVVFQFILINMFIGILCDSFNEVRSDSDKQTNEYEILQFISNRMKALVGIFVEPPIRPEYNWPKSDLEKKVETIEEKADTTMYFMRNLCDEDVRQIKWFQPDLWSRKKSKVMSLVLNSHAQILENDLCDGIEAMNDVIEKYSENELDRMIATSRMKKRIGSAVASVLTGSVISIDEESEEVISQASQDILDDHVSIVQEMQGSHDDNQDTSKHNEEEPDEEEEDERDIEEQWEDELELLEERLENFASRYESCNTPGRFVIDSTLSLRGASVTEMLKGTQDVACSWEEDDSVMKTATSLEITSSASPELLNETQENITEVRSQSDEDKMEDDVFQSSLPQSVAGNTSPLGKSILAWVPGSTTGNNTIVFVANDSRKSGRSGNEYLTSKGEEEEEEEGEEGEEDFVPQRKESEA